MSARACRPFLSGCTCKLPVLGNATHAQQAQHKQHNRAPAALAAPPLTIKVLLAICASWMRAAWPLLPSCSALRAATSAPAAPPALHPEFPRTCFLVCGPCPATARARALQGGGGQRGLMLAASCWDACWASARACRALPAPRTRLGGAVANHHLAGRHIQPLLCRRGGDQKPPPRLPELVQRGLLLLHGHPLDARAALPAVAGKRGGALQGARLVSVHAAVHSQRKPAGRTLAWMKRSWGQKASSSARARTLARVQAKMMQWNWSASW